MLAKIEHDDILEIRLERPPANALNPGLVNALHAAVETAPAAGARAIVLSGAPGMFSGGLDVPELLRLNRSEIHDFWGDFIALLKSIALSQLPIAAAITGHSPAGGAVLALYCDTRIAAQGEFKIGLNEVRVGLPVPRVILEALARLVGPRQAERLAVRGLLLSPDEALEAGLVDRITAPEDVVSEAIGWSRELTKLPPHAMRITRAGLRADLGAQFESFGPSTQEEMTETWFGAETRTALKTLVEQLAARRK